MAATVAASTADVSGAIVNIGGGSSVTLKQVLRTAEQVTGRTVQVNHAAVQAGDVPATSADLALARRLLRYRPAVDLATGMARQAAWLADLPADLLYRYLPARQEVAG